MTNLDQSIINTVNNWYDNLTVIEESDYVKYEFSKNKFRDRYLSKTGEFLKISKRLEAVTFAKICKGLSANYELTEVLIDKYLDWCFDNYDFFVKKYKGFNLNSCAMFASEWKEDFLKFEFEEKTSLGDLETVEVKSNIFLSFEKYGIPLVATKLCREMNSDKSTLTDMIVKKLNGLTDTKEDLTRLRNMLRVSVENGPYPPDILLNNYRQVLSSLFMYFTNEPWSQ